MEATFDTAHAGVKDLVADFQANETYFLSPQYQEAEARRDFIDKFLILLGWDVNHDRQKNPYEQEVKVERKDHGISQRRADYAFYLAPNFRDVKFYIEAKKPHGDIATPDNYFQTIRYGWNSQTPIAVLFDFEQLEVVDCRYKPDLETALQRNLKKFHFKEYSDAEKFGEIYWLISREAVAAGSLEKYADTLPRKRGAVQRNLQPGVYQSIDEAFLEELDEHRTRLARIFKNNNPQLDGETLTELTQRTLDRLVFIRFLEDKLIEPNYLVANFGNKGSVWGDFIAASRRLDGIYNGIVFKKNDVLDAPSLEVDDDQFGKICGELSHVNSPYDFNAIPIHILGSIYERFLGKVIVATGKRAKVEEKPEVRKAGGVYYTPEYIVRYIVANTVGKLIEGRTPAQIAEMRFADIACGSGSFLLSVYDLLLRHHTKFYNDNPGRAKKGETVAREDGLHLSLQKKREILINNVYGVDIDAQAVEVAQLSLYLKLLQDETPGTTRQYLLDFEQQALLPSLSANVVCGNSLIGTDISSGELFSADEERKLNPMDFEQRFPKIIARGGFDAVVGNPPYIRIQTLQESSPGSADYLKQHFTAASKGNYDVYVVFLERALSLLNSKGLVGYIVPHKFFNAQYGEPLRRMLSSSECLSKVVHFGHQQIFEGATTYTCLLFLSKHAVPACAVIRIEDLKAWRSGAESREELIQSNALGASDWTFTSGSEGLLLEKLRLVTDTLETITERIFQGIKTSADKIYIVEKLEERSGAVRVFSPHLEGDRWLEKELLHPLIKGGDSRRYSISKTNRLILFPYYNDKVTNAASLIPIPDLKIKYPKTWAYLSENKGYLESRENSALRGPSWYAYGRNQALDVMSKPKVFTPDLAAHASFSEDKKGELFFTGGVAGGYGIIFREGVSAKYCLGLLNSRLLEWVIAQTATQMRGGYFSFESRFIRTLPMRIARSDLSEERVAHDKMVSLVIQMISAKEQLAASLRDKDKNFYENKCAALDRQIDALVYELYELTPEEIQIVEGAV